MVDFLFLLAIVATVAVTAIALWPEDSASDRRARGQNIKRWESQHHKRSKTL